MAAWLKLTELNKVLMVVCEMGQWEDSGRVGECGSVDKVTQEDHNMTYCLTLLPLTPLLPRTNSTGYHQQHVLAVGGGGGGAVGAG